MVQPLSVSVCASGIALPRESQPEKNMTTMSSTAAQRTSANPSGGFVRWIEGWVNSLAAHWVRREAIKALRQLDDRALRDIGISRCHIERAVWGIVDRELGRLR